MILILRSIHWQDRWRLDISPANSLDRKANVLTQSCRSEPVPSWGPRWCATQRRASEFGLHSWSLDSHSCSGVVIPLCVSLVALITWNIYGIIYMLIFLFLLNWKLHPCLPYVSPIWRPGSQLSILVKCMLWLRLSYSVFFFVYFIFYISQILRLSVTEMINIHKSQSGGSWTSMRTDSWEHSAQGHGVCSPRSWAELLRSGHCRCLSIWS